MTVTGEGVLRRFVEMVDQVSPDDSHHVLCRALAGMVRPLVEGDAPLSCDLRNADIGVVD